MIEQEQLEGMLNAWLSDPWEKGTKPIGIERMAAVRNYLRPLVIEEVLYAVREELQRGLYGFSGSYFRWDLVRESLAEPAKEEHVKDGRAEEHLSNFKSGGLSPFAPREIVDFRAPQPGESTQPSYVAYMAMTPAEREACVQKAEEIPQPQIHDAILAKMVSDLVLTVTTLTLRVNALADGLGAK